MILMNMKYFKAAELSAIGQVIDIYIYIYWHIYTVRERAIHICISLFNYFNYIYNNLKK